ncbi:hypothetical protein HY346_01500 [Candidatus Microgenomates bacterium]|nr:hypothetical protein [Candidatus Microgenomates bacterium]
MGCYVAGDIFLLDIDRPELRQVVEVTAAHEMLHAAYDRLGTKERQRVDGLVDQFYRSYRNQQLAGIVKQYQQSEPGQLPNELHSLLATQVTKLSTELETYYQRYFSDRQKVVKSFLAYEDVFTKINQQREQLLSEIASLRSQIDALEGQAEAATIQARQLGQQIEELRRRGEVAESNILVPDQNAAANKAASLNIQITSLVREHNRLVDKVNQLAILQNDLLESLDSRSFTSS